jgi:maltose alpha-D-glucosyltransferase / alpha-amylase
MQMQGLNNDPLWFKDAIIYQLHIKTFFDSNADGYGDFAGLMQKLDYVQDLGVNCLWILPFYPSPLRDDGYDIADYKTINPTYGSLDDFKRFMNEAHERGIRVITELVLNHTSDQHPWFQAAVNSPAGSPQRDYYVFSDTDDKYRGVRIIFTDTEKSNWTYHPIAKQYYWHRFFHHQPDLNFDNPRMLNEMLDVLSHWLELGSDGFRLDAVPYLIERDGTTCEGLPETHAVLKKIRKFFDEKYKNRIMLGEANLWAKEVRPFFGDSDECHMNYHFPVMPRLYMAVHQEDRQPIINVMRDTPDIPADCQWVTFLRNHDELTLEMVTDEERAYMNNAYAPDPRMRINVGIRRRLAPLMDNDIQRIKLMNNLLMSMIGTPIVYYGDEIGMGDNIYLKDRDGVRTPMQWSPDQNAGFSKARPEKLYAQPIRDVVYGYQSVNVESQIENKSSLLNWTKDIIALRKKHKVFGRGTLEFIEPENRRVLVYLRKYEQQIVLVVSNLSRNAQSVSIDLSSYDGYVPLEMFGNTAFPAISKQPYILTLGPHAFYWLDLTKR